MVSVAMDAQGWTRASPFVRKARLTFPAVVDREGVLWERFGFNFVPLQLLFDDTGRLVHRSRGGPDADLLAEIDQALRESTPGGASAAAPSAERSEARTLFARGVTALESGRKDEARRLWDEALALDPDNWLIRKQVWTLESPDRFWDGPIDFEWQRRRSAADD